MQLFHSTILIQLFLLTNLLFSVNARPRELRGLAIVNGPFLTDGSDNNITGGILYDLFNQIWRKLNITVQYIPVDKIPSTTNTSLLNYIANGTYDFVLGYPVSNQPSTEEGRYDVDKINIMKDSLMVFTPNILSLLIKNVLWEVFFIFGIILLPWILINSLIFYLMQKRRLWKLGFFGGFYEAFRTMVFHGKRMSKFAKAYSLTFYIMSVVLVMLLLGDFIYIIAALVRRLDVNDVKESISSGSKICSVQGDYLVQDFVSKRREISLIHKPSIISCLEELDRLHVGSFLVSSSIITSFFHEYPKYNNRFNYFVKDSLAVDYHMILNRKLRLEMDVQKVLESLRPEVLPDLISNYMRQPVFHKILPNSIFSESILLIFLSLTITATFLIIFLSVLVYKKTRRGSNQPRKIIRKEAERLKRKSSHSEMKPNRTTAHSEGSTNHERGYSTIEIMGEAGLKKRTGVNFNPEHADDNKLAENEVSIPMNGHIKNQSIIHQSLKLSRREEVEVAS